MRQLVHKLVVSIFVFIILILIGAYAYHWAEGYNALDSVYFTVITVTTIGYGDMYPVTTFGKIFTMFYSFLGIAMALYLFSLLGKYLLTVHFNLEVKKRKK